MIETFIPAPSKIKRNAYYWKSPSTEQSFKNPLDFNDLELATLRAYMIELSCDISTLNRQKTQVIDSHKANQSPPKSYMHHVNRMDSRRDFLRRLRTGVESAIERHPDRYKAEKRFVHSLQDACTQLLSTEQYREVMHLATEQHERKKAKPC